MSKGWPESPFPPDRVADPEEGVLHKRVFYRTCVLFSVTSSLPHSPDKERSRQEASSSVNSHHATRISTPTLQY